ncbi:hypothetical protein FACS1894154_11110 [Betaproteobacteria bacterium]|nr:hypothetical protein FACS1894154_11110 [Betaproteobacteria bacterium]GHU14353.1 hypothetical protein FACS189441_3770 [Betaproteobacteria bacterium]GHU29233.1 hypothetical protein FACS189497_06790 [Betaproteobacteria bacterium]
MSNVSRPYMRLLGFLGLVALALLNLIGLTVALQERDWKGIFIMLSMAALLTFFAVILWRGAKLERDSADGRLTDGWEGESVTTFFKAVVARSLEGRIFIVGAAVSVLVAILALVWPEAIGVSPAKGFDHAALFGLWPIASFVLFVHICGPHYQTSAITALLTLAVTAVPFYIAYW